RFHAAKRQAAIVRRSGAAQHLMGLADALIELRIAHRDGAKQKIAVAANVLGQRLHGDVNAMGKSVEVDSSGPGIVQHYQRALTVNGFSNSRHVLNFHGDRAGTFAPDQARVWTKGRADFSARARRIVTDVHAKASQNI